MNVGKQLQQIRLAKRLSQGDIEKRTGLLRCYVSRVENGHTIPSPDTLEKLVKAMGLEMWEFFAEVGVSPEPAQVKPQTPFEKKLFGLLKKASQRDMALFLSVADKLGRQGGKNGRRQGTGHGKRRRTGPH